MCCPLKNAAYTNLWLNTFNSQWHMHTIFLLSLTPPAATAIAFAQCILWFWTFLMVFVSHGLVGVLCLHNHIRQLIVVYQKRLSLQQFHSIQPTIAYYTLTNQIHNTNIRNLTIYCFSGVILNSLKKQDSTNLYSISCMP